MRNNKTSNIIIIFLSIILVILTFNLIKSNNQIKELKSYQAILEKNNDNLLKEKESLDTQPKDNTVEKSDEESKEDTNTEAEQSQSIEQKEILFYNQDDLANMTEEDISFTNVDNIYIKLSEVSTWVNEGFSNKDSEAIANRFKMSNNQAKGILRGVTKQNKPLKLILIPLGDVLKVNIGSGSPNYK